MGEKVSICFVTDAHQEKYVNKFNLKVKNFDSDFFYYVCTDLPHLIQKKENLKVFSLSELQNRHPESLNYEKIDDEVSYSNYPWNNRRHIINKAFEDGFDYVIWTDCDVELGVDKELLMKELMSYQIDNVYTQSTIWKYSENLEQRMFHNCDLVLKYLNNEINKTELITHDGPTAIYYLSKEKQNLFIKYWDDITLYGYESKYYRKGNWFIPNLSYVFPLSKVGLKSVNKKLFKINHNTDDRY